MGDDLDPFSISELFGALPTKGVQKGETHLTPKGTAVIARTGMWHLKAPDSSPANFDGQILDLLAPLSGDLAMWRDISERYQGHVFAGLFLEAANEGTSVRPQTLAALADRGLGLQLDVYQFGGHNSL